MGEVSSTGMHAEIGVILLEVPEGSKLKEFGFKERDVIYEYWGQELQNAKGLFLHYNSRPKGENIPMTVLRDQATIEVYIN